METTLRNIDPDHAEQVTLEVALATVRQLGTHYIKETGDGEQTVSVAKPLSLDL